jgi:2-polyprenyl-3-methyl-5-hydroxy-6-metoxy-1,4-benzoquinol methylase
MRYRLRDFLVDNSSNVRLPQREHFQISYTDGKEIEERIYGIINSSHDRSVWSPELIHKITDWPSEYHFSPLRHNLLRHFSLKNTDHILELGCGCGAITRQLGESGADITSIDGSLSRAKCAAERCKDLSNVKVYCSNFRNIEFDQQYDYVTLIGVLEYAPLFFDCENPLSECLLVAKNALKKDGTLIIAIENRLGLKYFNGFSEDHVGKPYFGIEDLYQPNTAKTLGKQELKELLRNVGFNEIRFQYPFPDYKLPEVILDESALKHKGFDCAELIRSLKSRDYSGKSQNAFSEFMAWKTINANGLLGDLSNSFLVTASTENMDSDSQFLAVKYTTNRKLEYNTKTEFVQADRDVKVLKSHLVHSRAQSELNLVQNLKQDRYYEGISLSTLIRETIHKNNFQEFGSHIQNWLDYLCEYGMKEKNAKDKFDTPLLPHFIDCLPGNIITMGQSLVFIDTEWEYDKPFCIKTLFLRYWLNEMYWLGGASYRDFILKHIPSPSRTPTDLLCALAALFEVHFNKNSIREGVQVFEEVSKTVYGANSTQSALLTKEPDINSSHENMKFMNKLKNKLKRILLIY